MLKVMITGAAGQFGRELFRVLEERKSETWQIPPQYDKCEIITVPHAELDISNRAAVSLFVNQIKPNIIINPAAKTDVDACETDHEDAFRINAIGARNMAIAAFESGASLVHLSTDYVFQGDGNSPLCEWDIPNPKTIYGKSKLLGERYVRQFCPESFIVRTAWLYGREGRNFVKTILKNAKEKDTLRVVSDQRGCPTNAEDLAYHVLKLAVTKEYGLYHCAGNGECSWFDFADKIVKYAGIDCKVIPCTTDEYPSPAPRPKYSVMQNMMLRCTAGDDMRYWEDALRSFIHAIS